MSISHPRIAVLATVALVTAFAAGAPAQQPTESVWQASSGLSPEQVCPFAWESFRHNAATCGGTTSTTTSTVASTTVGPTTTTVVLPSSSTTTVVFPSSSTTTVVFPTSTTAPPGPTSSSTTVVPASTTTTTIPVGCDDVTPGSLPAVLCRLDILADRIADEPDLGSFRAKLQSTLALAIARAQEGQTACTSGDTKTTRRRMKQTNRFLQKMSHRLSNLRARKNLDPTLRTELITTIESIRSEVGLLRRTTCS